MLFFADSGEGVPAQAMLMGSATTVIVLTLAAINALDHPYRAGLGQIKPVAMERSLRILDARARRRERPRPGSVRRAGRSGLVLTDDREAAPLRPPLRARGDRAARGGGGGHRLGVLPVGALARRAGEGPERIGRRARRVDARGERGESAGGRSTSRCSRSGSTPTRATRPSSPTSTRKRFRPEFKPAFDAWVATRPRKNPSAPLSPFAMPQYKLAATAKADRLEAQAAASSQRAGGFIRRADDYSLAVVLFASSLFFAGISTRLRSPTTRMVVLGLGYALFLGSVIWIATFPVSLSV